MHARRQGGKEHKLRRQGRNACAQIGKEHRRISSFCVCGVSRECAQDNAVAVEAAHSSIDRQHRRDVGRLAIIAGSYG